MCAALDIGTTFSSFAYSYVENKDDIKGCEEWGSNLGILNPKAPTTVLVDERKNFVSFGYEAQEEYLAMDEETAKKHSLFECFKLNLMEGEVSCLTESC